MTPRNVPDLISLPCSVTGKCSKEFQAQELTLWSSSVCWMYAMPTFMATTDTLARYFLFFIKIEFF